MSARRVAAVDCGTNTIKLLVADLDPSTHEETELLRAARMVRLGQDVDRDRRLADAALARVLAAVDEFADLVQEHDVPASAVRFCCTSAVRDASNAEVFLDGVERRLGVRPEVVSGATEAALSYAGATRVASGLVPPVLVVDVGGGSTELVLGGGAGPTAARSLDIGSVRLTERYLAGDPPTAAEVGRARAEVDRQLDTLPDHGVVLGDARTVVAVSGTGLTVAAAVLDLPELSREALDGATVPVSGVLGAVDRLLGMTVEQRRALPYMHPGRADVIGGGALVLAAVLRRAGVDELRVSVRDILDGIAWSVADRR
jgi:exopolyphosphatase/guanosine-5'-triphosphate,3'-diphosphate pyrophosphatase